ncbi:DUF4255 domain-containing protein [Methanosarcina sp. DH2]|uniref:DUF4255 domain-containing protein n=1 Tax=Methanosarcina sp. DH2 TaxID=2605639 RepID=UPI001E463C1E|nr:DUF4255 domain-containing protein [Methanosarcina sp. DH2]MCC4769575.1 DUF4255 domain-containing protein [Methanosarcina sp. DH2]
MSDYRSIADVGETLIELLRDNMEELVDRESIVLFSPGEIDSSDNVRLSLFLYQVFENTHLRNQEMQVKDPDTLTFPPLTLELYYMLTPHTSSGVQDKTARSLEEHTVLGRAIRVLYDHSILKGSLLKGNLNKNEELHIMMSSLNMEDLTKIWSTFPSKSFRPSVCYVVTPVQIDSGREVGVQRVVSREINYAYYARKGGK